MNFLLHHKVHLTFVIFSDLDPYIQLWALECAEKCFQLRQNSPGLPVTVNLVNTLILCMAKSNPSWTNADVRCLMVNQERNSLKVID